MLKGKFEFIIASPFDRENLVCEILYESECIAEISQENEKLSIEIYPPPKKEFWEIPLLEFQEALQKAKEHLLEK